MKFNQGIEVCVANDLRFSYGVGVRGPETELRKLADIRSSLLDPDCDGPDLVYGIAMDVAREEDMPDLVNRMLLFGIVVYEKGRLGKEPVRSQGHIHKVSAHCAWSTPEVYEIWQGQAVILMQETAKDDPGRCYAVHANPGEVVIVPPGWAHATISADPAVPLVFGAWCDRDYGFEYEDVRSHKGLAFYPVLDEKNKIIWNHNDAYISGTLQEKTPESYEKLGIVSGIPIYSQYVQNREKFQFVSDPGRITPVWETFVP